MQTFKEHATETREAQQLEESWAKAFEFTTKLAGSAARGLSDMAKKKSGKWVLTGFGGLTLVGFLGSRFIDKLFQAGKETVEAITESIKDPKVAAFIVILVTLGVTASQLPSIINALRGARNENDVYVILQREGVDISEDDEIVIDNQDIRNAAREMKKLL